MKAYIVYRVSLIFGSYLVDSIWLNESSAKNHKIKLSAEYANAPVQIIVKAVDIKEN